MFCCVVAKSIKKLFPDYIWLGLVWSSGSKIAIFECLSAFSGAPGPLQLQRETSLYFGPNILFEHPVSDLRNTSTCGSCFKTRLLCARMNLFIRKLTKPAACPINFQSFAVSVLVALTHLTMSNAGKRKSEAVTEGHCDSEAVKGAEEKESDPMSALATAAIQATTKTTAGKFLLAFCAELHVRSPRTHLPLLSCSSVTRCKKNLNARSKKPRPSIRRTQWQVPLPRTP